MCAPLLSSLNVASDALSDGDRSITLESILREKKPPKIISNSKFNLLLIKLLFRPTHAPLVPVDKQ